MDKAPDGTLGIGGKTEGDAIGCVGRFGKESWKNGTLREKDVFYGIPTFELLGKECAFSVPC